ncbi:haloacid dehalogenase-like hydrolase domain-containing protein 3 [Antedon mediterranea]|uniref:haloacid dehalogenase-like hydrolase domain-containing protein 3 n=1 Tax=Antedon mediterranea TaxID=105859 RepID=UPI003AF5B7D3
MKNVLKLLTFDVNNTIIKVRHSVGHHYSKTASAFGVEADPAKVQSAFLEAYREQKSTQPNYGDGLDTTTERWWTDIVKKTFILQGHSNIETLEQIGAKLYQDFLEPSYWDVFPDVKNVLSYLNKQGMCVGVISNFDERLIQVLKNLELAHHFSFIIPSIFAKYQKPQPQIFQKALDLMKVAPNECLHIGDSVKNDYYAAQDIGMNALIIDRDGTLQRNHPDINRMHFINNLEDLKQFVDSS